jgi:hypothetical protein
VLGNSATSGRRSGLDVELEHGNGSILKTYDVR